ncbi:TIM-barrel domain-containing protein [Phenylobacterium deserti]|uniref:Alpha-glucosidase n=1 Tax=Phenylobacterium deserti TaxID=1914756 RepID=A0A328A9A2_9CAUL|nr:TIM-barrel domain-containing protein [Phenylobacterium deserti]RAK51099.1 alpha-glucosidase [Phenylobacterium deserti]
MTRLWAAGALAGLLAGSAQADPLALLDRNGAFVSVEPYGPNIVRVTISDQKDLALASPGPGFLGASAAAGWTHQAGASGDVFRSGALSVEVSPQPRRGPPSQMERYFASALPPVSVTFRRGDGEVLTRMNGWDLAPHTVNGEKTFKAGASFSVAPNEHFYGLGQNQEGILDHRGRTIDCRHNYDAPAGETVCVPFLVTNRGYGVLWDNPSQTTISAAVNGSTRWTSNVGERVSFFVIAGATSDEIYAGYRKLTGVTPLPPKAAFGLIQSRARYENQQQVLDVAEGYRSRGYPLDVMVVDWFHWTRMGQMDINPVDWPDPAGMNRQLHANGLHSIISVWPRYEPEGRYFNYLASKGWFLKDADGKPVDGLPVRNDRAGALLDTTNPEARAWFWEKIRDNIASQGFDWFWLDETEPDLVPSGYFYSVGSGDRFYNLYPLVHPQSVAEGSRRDRPNFRNLILARAAYTGAQRHGSLFWSSDIQSTWEALRRQVPTGLNFTASGFAYWGNDIGGWQSLPAEHKAERPLLVDPSDARESVGGYEDYPELFVRWFQYGTFTPTLRIHGLRKHSEVWSYGKDAEAHLARFLKLRYELIPYLYSLGKQTYDTGAPFMRALWMDFPNDPTVANIGDAYMLGPAFLVAPVTEQGVTSRKVYLPAGTDWYDFWTGTKAAGGQWIDAAAPIDRIPVFVRAGSILPIGAPVPNTMTPQKIAAIRVYPGRNARFALYDDDGVTNDYEKGRGRTAVLSWDDAAGRLSVSGDKALAGDPARLLQVVGR